MGISPTSNYCFHYKCELFAGTNDLWESLLYSSSPIIAVASNVSSEHWTMSVRVLTHFLRGWGQVLPSDMGCCNWVFVCAPNIGSLELVKAGIKKNVNNSNKCRKPFTNEAKSPLMRWKKQIKPKWSEHQGRQELSMKKWYLLSNPRLLQFGCVTDKCVHRWQT